MSAGRSTDQLRGTLAQALPERPFTVELWDGSTLPATNGSGGLTFRLRSPGALGHVLRAPGQLGLGRAYVSGEIEVDDLAAALDLLDGYTVPPLEPRLKARLAGAALRAGALRTVPRVPAIELRPRGRRHSRERDQRAIAHHYDVSDEFFRLILGESMTYSCAFFSRGAKTLEEAQWAKLELVCTKLGLHAGERVLDVGCGWGSFALHAAREHGVHVVGITLSAPQAALARQRAEAAGLAGQIEIRLADYRDLGGEQFDAISSIGMVEHVGSVNIDAYARQLERTLRPGGRLLNHGIARLRYGDPEAGPFSERYVFPDAAPLHVSRVLTALEAAGLEPTHVEGFRPDYIRTLQEWARNLEANAERAEALIGPERMRVWRLYLHAARRGFEKRFTSIFQVVANRP
ncbi:MAG TPA: cyclopropane-fatty-acyl-phospholipid synthase family protein [Solirubrobacteraceae bacterium]|nr:cyclopropane-fatty-acyl-phospholipid synthase family protein [Solirubrobacteraceae bacterium]